MRFSNVSRSSPWRQLPASNGSAHASWSPSNETLSPPQPAAVDAGVAIADSTAVQSATKARPSLSGEQRELVASLTQSGRGVDVVRAPAGAGKTFALDAAREAWQPQPVSRCSAVRSRRGPRANCATRRLSRRRRSPTSLAHWISASSSRPGRCCSSTRLRWSGPVRSPACPTPWWRRTASSCWSVMTASCQRSKLVAYSERSRTSSGRWSCARSGVSTSRGIARRLRRSATAISICSCASTRSTAGS